tara:strand:- start:2188 stop:2511 length:324 start_codon:yes stop_codon:yes gene_type:complete
MRSSQELNGAKVNVGDLVTLSSYVLQTSAMYTWRRKIWHDKKKIVGLVIGIQDNPNICEYTSENEKKYYFVRWMPDGPAGRWNTGNLKAAAPYQTSYFFRNDLKFVK